MCRLHDLRHSFASRALALGESLPMIGKLLGHSRIETTARYAHLARESVHESAARIADSIAAELVPNGGELRTALIHELRPPSPEEPVGESKPGRGQAVEGPDGAGINRGSGH